MTVNQILDDFSKAFRKKIERSYSIRIQLEIRDIPDKIWQIDVSNGNVNVYSEEKITPEEIIIISGKEILDKLYKNEISALSAFLQRPEEKDDMMGALIREKNEPVGKDFISRMNIFTGFFSKDFPAKIIIDKKNCVKHNGGIDTIGLKTFGKFGQIFISVKKGETLYYPALGANIEINIYVIKGSGKLTAGNDECEIKEREYYYMNLQNCAEIKNTVNEEPLEAIVILQLPGR
ncbi:MAG: hypothetical protein LBG94_10355 [Treponema sp.]|jgi:hypothetical protein|nr:hypothetical protein [Treponema sp.]